MRTLCNVCPKFWRRAIAATGYMLLEHFVLLVTCQRRLIVCIRAAMLLLLMIKRKVDV